jgi:alpha-tubulin suppressor-like RCC1 family protein
VGDLGGTQVNTLSFVSFTGSLNMRAAVELSSENGDHNCVLLISGAVVCWGSNSNGQLGLNLAANAHMGDSTNEMLNVAPIVFAATITQAVVQVATGLKHTCGTFTYFSFYF